MSEYECGECGKDVASSTVFRNYRTKVCPVCYTPEPEL